MAILERLYTGDDGFSHFETRELDFSEIDSGTGLEFLGVGWLMLREPPQRTRPTSMRAKGIGSAVGSPAPARSV